MDDAVIAALRQAWIRPDAPPKVLIQLGEDGRLRPIGEEVVVGAGKRQAVVRLKPITALYAGAARPPDFLDAPPPAYLPFFEMIERAALDYCIVAGKHETDDTFAELYRHLRRRPDGRHDNPLFSYLQAAARLYMSLHNVSREEFEAVAARLTLSGRHFSLGVSTTNYIQTLLNDPPPGG